MLRQRLLTAIVGVPLVGAAVWFGNPWYVLMVGIVALLAAWEFYGLAGLRDKILAAFGLLWVVLLVLSPLTVSPLVSALLLTAGLVFPLFWETTPFSERTFAKGAWTIAGIIYVGWMLGHLTALREVADGRGWVFLALFSTFASDTASYLGGKTLGRHRLVPVISPGKTYEGALFGVLGAMLASAGFSALFHLHSGFGYGVLLGLFISLFAQGGDLVESLLKRNAGVKDSGRLLPGHGGILDRVDSIVFSIPVVYYYVAWLLK